MRVIELLLYLGIIELTTKEITICKKENLLFLIRKMN